MNLPQVPEVPADGAVTPGSIGQTVSLLHCKLAASAGAVAAGGAGVDLAELGRDSIKAHRLTVRGAQQEQAGAPDQPILQQILDKVTGLEGSVAQLREGQAALQRSVAELQAGQAELRAGQAELRAGQAELKAGLVWASNQSARVFNSQARMADQLAPLRKERPPAGNNAAPLGALPPQGTFPSTSTALEQLQGRELDALETFYEEEFGGRTVAERRQSFRRFIFNLV